MAHLYKTTEDTFMLVLFLIFFFGAIIGSFINALVYRVYNQKNWVSARSACPNCLHFLGFFDLVPVFSFLFLKGRCRYCRKKISWEYLFSEIALGAVFVLFFLKYFGVIGWEELLFLPESYFIWFLLSDFLICSVLLFLFLYDLKYYLILDKITLPFVLIFAALNYFLGYNIWDIMIGGVVGFLFFALQFWLSKGKWVGGGDARMGLLMGVILGWKYLIMALVFSYWLGAIVGISLILLKKKTMKSMVPFGTFLAVGTIITMLWGEKIMEWYLFPI